MAATSSPRRPALLIGGGVLVVALGFGLPQLLTNPAPAPPAASPADPPPGPSLGAALGRLAACLVVVSGLCVAAARWANQKAAAPAGPMAAAGSIRVDARCAVHLVTAGGRRLLVGTDPGGVKALLELPAVNPHAVAEDLEAVTV